MIFQAFVSGWYCREDQTKRSHV